MPGLDRFNDRRRDAAQDQQRILKGNALVVKLLGVRSPADDVGKTTKSTGAGPRCTMRHRDPMRFTFGVS